MTFRQILTDIADRERREVEPTIAHVPNQELLRQNFSIIAEYARARIERILAAEQKHEANGKAATAAEA